MGAKIEGVEEVLQALETLTDTNELEKALGKACAVVERAAKQKAPKGSGELRRSIKSNVEGLTGTIYTALMYAPYVEYGTGLFAEKGGRQDVPWVYCDDEGNFYTTYGMPPQPFLRPALYENREEILRKLKGG